MPVFSTELSGVIDFLFVSVQSMQITIASAGKADLKSGADLSLQMVWLDFTAVNHFDTALEIFASCFTVYQNKYLKNNLLMLDFL